MQSLFFQMDGIVFKDTKPPKPTLPPSGDSGGTSTEEKLPPL